MGETESGAVPQRHVRGTARASGVKWTWPFRLRPTLLGPAALLAAGLAAAAPAHASSFEGRVAAGAGYLWNDTKLEDSKGPAVSLQGEAGLRLVGPLALNALLFYDSSSWLEIEDTISRKDGSVLGLGLGGSLRYQGWLLGLAAGGQFTAFPQRNDPYDTYNAGLGPFVSVSAGHVWDLPVGGNLGVLAFYRARRAKDETNSFVYDPVGYQLGLALTFGLDGTPLLGP